MKTTLVLAATLAIGLPCAARADLPSPPPNVYRALESGRPAHAAGSVRGTIEAVDYAGGSILVRGAHGTESIAVLPSTTIYGGREYATFSDLHKGQVVEVTVSAIDGRLVAQSISVK